MGTINAGQYLESGEAPSNTKFGGTDIDNNVVVRGDISNIPLSASYISVKTEPSLILTNVYQTVTGWIDFLAPVAISEDVGVFTFAEDGIYTFSIERGYNNPDRAPLSLIELSISVWKNGILAFERTGIIGAATATDEPTYLSITSPSILSISAGDQYEIKVKASEGSSSPSGGCELSIMQITANKIHNEG